MFDLIGQDGLYDLLLFQRISMCALLPLSQEAEYQRLHIMNLPCFCISIVRNLRSRFKLKRLGMDTLTIICFLLVYGAAIPYLPASSVKPPVSGPHILL